VAYVFIGLGVAAFWVEAQRTIWRRSGHGTIALCIGIALGVVAGELKALVRPRRICFVRTCATCGYDLRATPDRCPECGTIPD